MLTRIVAPPASVPVFAAELPPPVKLLPIRELSGRPGHQLYWAFDFDGQRHGIVRHRIVL